MQCIFSDYMAGVVSEVALTSASSSSGSFAGMKDYRKTSSFLHPCSLCSIVCGSSLHCGHVGSAGESNKWMYALSSGVCPDRKRARKLAYARFELAEKIVAPHGSSGPIFG